MTDYPESEEPKMEGEDDGSITTLVPKSMFPDCKPGDTLKLKVVAALEDELEVEAVSEKKESDKPERDSLDMEMESMPLVD